MRKSIEKDEIRILHLIPNLGTGGAQRVFSQLSEFLTSHFRVDLYAFDSNAKEAYSKNLVINTLDVEGSNSFVQKLFNLFWRIRKLSKIKEREKFDVSISHLEGADLINVLTGNGDKKVVVIHGAKASDIKYKGIYKFFRHKILIPQVVKKADKVICVSEGIKQELIHSFQADPSKLVVIPNYFDHERIEKLAQASIENPVINSIFENYQVIINCARLDIQKNQAPLIDIFSKCKMSSDKIKLIVLGEGSMLEILINQARSSGLNVFSYSESKELSQAYDVYFLGNQPNPFSYISRAKLSVLTSGWEGFPLVVGESMICGTPIISTDCPTGPREILAPKTPLNYNLRKAEFAEYGILMPLLDKENNSYNVQLEQWEQTINYVVNSPEVLQQYSVKGIERSKDFSKEVIVNKWMELIRSLHKSS